jgi:hypothetical protein
VKVVVITIEDNGRFPRESGFRCAKQSHEMLFFPERKIHFYALGEHRWKEMGNPKTGFC